MSIAIVNPKLCYQRPTVGPKHYVSVGASGWVETFDRRQADKALKAYVQDVPLGELVSNFVDQRVADDRKETFWHDVISYLGRVFSVRKDSIPIQVGIAFWGQVALDEDTKEAN